MNFRKFWKTYLITFFVTSAIGSGAFCLYYFLMGKGLLNACNGTSLVGIFLICACGLIYVSREGFFDIFGYGFKQLGTMIFGRKPNAYNDFPGYKEQKRVYRVKSSKYFVIIGIVGLLFVTAFIILRIRLSYYY